MKGCGYFRNGLSSTLILSTENSTSGKDKNTDITCKLYCHSLIAKAKLPKLLFSFTQSVGSSVHPQKKTVQEDNRYFLKSCCPLYNIGTCSRSGQSIPCTSLFPGTSYLTLPADKSYKMHIPLKAGFQHFKPKEILSQELPHPPAAQNK